MKIVKNLDTDASLAPPSLNVLFSIALLMLGIVFCLQGCSPQTPPQDEENELPGSVKAHGNVMKCSEGAKTSLEQCELDPLFLQD